MQKAFRIISLLVPVAAIVLIVFQVVFSNELAMLGKKMGQLDMAVVKEQDVHETLETQVASASSLMALRERALTLGFHEPTQSQIIAISPKEPVAFGVALTHTIPVQLP